MIIRMACFELIKVRLLFARSKIDSEITKIDLIFITKNRRKNKPVHQKYNGSQFWLGMCHKKQWNMSKGRDKFRAIFLKATFLLLLRKVEQWWWPAKEKNHFRSFRKRRADKKWILLLATSSIFGRNDDFMTKIARFASNATMWCSMPPKNDVSFV